MIRKVLAAFFISLPMLLQAVELKSPDGTLKIDVAEKDSRLVYTISHEKGVLVEESRLGPVIDGKDIGLGAVIGKVTEYSVDESYPWRGLKSRVRNHCNGKRVKMVTDGLDWELELRAYDEGIAFRYNMDSEGEFLVNGESTSWRLPKETSAWYQTQTINYEGDFSHNKIADIPLTTLGGPVTLLFPNGLFGALAEADIMGYSGMTYAVDGTYTLQSIFEDDPEGWKMSGPDNSAWRILMVAEDLNGLVNNDIIHNVCPTPDEELFPKGIETEWIKTGRTLWPWMAYKYAGSHWSRQKWFVDQAPKLGARYYLIDEGWEHTSQEWFKPGETAWKRLKELCDYAAERNVGIFVWRGWRYHPSRQWPGLETEAKRAEFFKKCAEAGVKGVKIDFMDSESNDRLDFYLDCLRKAAENGIMVNFHGANKPAGEPRTWPNEMTREGLKAMEYNGVSGQSLSFPHYTTLPFTRMLAGHADFTPTTFDKNLQHGTSSTLQLASSVILTSPILCWADKPENYLESSALKYILTMPTTWDETRVLEGSEIGKIAAYARRDGDEWYVAIMNGKNDIAIYDLYLDFLGSGKYMGEMVEDDMSDSVKMVHSSGIYSSDSKIGVEMLPGGGFLLRLSKLHVEPGGGSFHREQNVTITSIDPSSEIRYTLDGSEPAVRSRKLSGPVTLTETCELRAKIISGDGKGMQIRRSYTKVPLPEPGIVAKPESRDGRVFVVSMSTDAGAIHYTLDGSEPDSDSPVYQAPFKLDKDALIRAVALMDDKRSPVKEMHVRVFGPEPGTPDVFLEPAEFIKNEAGWGEPRINKSVTNKDLVVNGKRYERGIGTHANSEILLKCRPEYRQFVAVAGIDGVQADSLAASIVFKVVADGKVLEESPVLRKGALQHWHFDVEIPRGTDQLELIVTDAGDGNGYDHANWCNAGFML